MDRKLVFVIFFLFNKVKKRESQLFKNTSV